MANGWWNLDGAITSCVAAYQPMGAADYAASKVNLLNPGTYNLSDGAAYPDWASATGWTFEKDKSEYLDTGITIVGGYTIIARFANATDGSVVGFYKDNNSRYNLTPISGNLHSFHYGNSGAKVVGGAFALGNIALTPAAGYKNGVATVDLSSYTWSGTTTDTFPIGARRRGDTSSFDSFFSGDIIAIAFYNATLTPTQIGLLTTAMNALHVVTDALTAVDFTLNPVTFDAPILENIGSSIALTAKDLTLTALTFDAPTLVSKIPTPSCRTYAISAESRTFAIIAEARGIAIQCDSVSKYTISSLYSALSAKDLTLSPIIFDAATLSEDFNALIVFDGNSMTAGAYSSYPATTVSALVGTWTAHNFGVSGQTTIEMIADAAAQIDSLYDPDMLKNVVVFWEVTNDLKLGATRADAQARMVQYCQARKAAGWSVVVLTILPRTQVGLPETFEDDRIAINSYILANYASFADAVADVASDSRIGDYGDSNDTTYFYDGVHMTTAGYNIVAGIAATTINAL